MIAAHRQLRAKNPNLLTVIAPRHPGRGQSIAEIASTAGLSVGLRSRGDLPKRDIDIYVADTLGELGLVYSAAPIVFMGGSLVSHGGQNPIEAVRLGAAVLHGPHVWNFAEIYATLDEAHGAEKVADEAALTARLGDWLANPKAHATTAKAAAADRRKTRRRAGAHARRARSISDAAAARTAGVIELRVTLFQYIWRLRILMGSCADARTVVLVEARPRPLC